VAVPRPAGAPARTGAFSQVHARWLLLWLLVGLLLVVVLASITSVGLGFDLTDEALGIALYVPLVAWMAFVLRRHHIDLRVPLRWPRLGAYWGIVAGMFVVQLLFSMSTAILTQLVAPWLGEGQEEIGQGNLLLALVALVLLPPFVEEVLFRFVLLERFATKWRVRVAVVVTALAFGILHADPVGAGAFGVVTALLYLRTRSLWPGILVHAANNLLAVVVTRAAAPETQVADTTGTLLGTAAVFLVLSLPFLVWFVVTHWPAATAPTPYQEHEASVGMPSRQVSGVWWSAAPGQSLALTVAGGQVTLAPSPAHPPLAVLPLERVRAVYPTSAGFGEQVVVLLWDGSWTTLQVQGGSPAANRELAQVVGERAGLVALT
jgi:CAAX protease family protein